MRQVIQNLLSNAIKFTQQGSVTLKISATPLGEHDIALKVAVQDTGIGIPQEKQGDLFQPFSQADSGTTRKFGGTGLGLAICRRIVGLMQGEIQLQSEADVGSTFFFEVPVKVASVSQVKAKSRQENVRLALPGDQCVLLVEDNNVNQRLAKAILNELKLPYEVASDGLEAVQAFRPERFGVILMDCSMPRMDGYQATRIIRHLEEGHLPTPIIALTANALTGDREKALKAGMDDHLSKPYTVDDLQQVLSRWLRQEESSRQAG
jgi:CheY-like chemotaxis protein